jgi:hypothetical protein
MQGRPAQKARSTLRSGVLCRESPKRLRRGLLQHIKAFQTLADAPASTPFPLLAVAAAATTHFLFSVQGSGICQFKGAPPAARLFGALFDWPARFFTLIGQCHSRFNHPHRPHSITIQATTRCSHRPTRSRTSSTLAKHENSWYAHPGAGCRLPPVRRAQRPRRGG